MAEWEKVNRIEGKRSNQRVRSEAWQIKSPGRAAPGSPPPPGRAGAPARILFSARRDCADSNHPTRTLNPRDPMNRSRNLMIFAAFVPALLAPLRAADVAGKWHAEFDTQIGTQKYTYEFKVAGDKVTGTAAFERETGKGEVVLQDIKLDGDKIAFVEPLKVDDQEISITYSGTVSGDEMKLTRQVGDIATEELVARRVKEPAAAPAAPAK
jgi:hypothetical protein